MVIWKLLSSNSYCSRHGGKYYPEAPKSKSHQGTKVANQWIQLEIYCSDKKTILSEIAQEVKDIFPNANNIQIKSMIKL